jgi:ABC-type dipeptide/oligopeptide/nickel transport system permease component
MSTYILRKLMAIVPTIVGVVTFTFLMLRLAPGDTIDYILAGQEVTMTQEEIDAARARLGLDQPLYVQYYVYIEGVVTGDLGRSYYQRAQVAELLFSRVSVTLHLAFAATLITALIGLPSGVLSALKPNSIVDYFVITGSTIGLAAPNFWLGILFLYLFSFRLNWFPLFGSGDGGLASTLYHLVLPALALGMSGAALVARMTRSAVLEVLGKDYVRTARAKGLTEQLVIGRHVLRNALTPVVTVLGLEVAYLLGGSIIVEVVFARRGLGKLLIDALHERDYPVVQGGILLIVIAVVIANLIVDLIYAFLDPRVRYD